MPRIRWSIILVALMPVHHAVCDEPAPIKPAEGFSVVRDNALGKPLVTLRTPPKDANGRQAVDVLEQFLKYVRNGDVDKAKQFCQFEIWTDKSRNAIGRVSKDDLPEDPEYAKKARAELTASEALFPKFVEELRRANKYTLGATVKQKSNYWTMRVVAEGVQKQPWPYAVDLQYVDNKWAIIIHDLTYRYRE